MGVKKIISFTFTFLLIGTLVSYWFIPYNSINFSIKDKNYNFTLNNYDETGMQFYKNLRYQNKEISYNIFDCPIKKKEDMITAFDIIENKTILNFIKISDNGEISVTCDNKNKMSGMFFVAGEGGPINITKTSHYNIISKGQILLIKESQCENPNVAIHELLHALGFTHSTNPNNIMYNYSKCSQTISKDITNLINKIYSVETLPDLAFENITATMNGKYLSTNITIRNQGLINSKEGKLNIYADQKLVKEFNLDPIPYGEGKKIMITNLWIKKININKLRYKIVYTGLELDSQNNELVLEITK